MFANLLYAAVALTGIAYVVKRATIAIAAAAFWALLAFHSYSQAVTKDFGDIFFLTMWFCIGMLLAVALEAGYMKFGVAGSSHIPSDEVEEQQESKRSRHDEVMDELKRRKRDKESLLG